VVVFALIGPHFPTHPAAFNRENTMRKFIVALAAVSMIGGFSVATAVSAQTIDKNGKCHAADGKMAKMEVCTAASAKKAQCRDDKGKFIKCNAKAATAAKPATPATPATKTTTAKPATPATPAKK
jgi:hypothetical protein